MLPDGQVTDVILAKNTIWQLLKRSLLLTINVGIAWRRYFIWIKYDAELMTMLDKNQL